MTQAYCIALMGVTGPTVQTQFTRFDESWDVPMIEDADRLELYRAWLQSAAGSNEEQWTAVRRNWVSFLSATSTRPNTDLAPNRKTFLTSSKSAASGSIDTDRFERDCRVRSSIQAATYLAFDRIEALTGKWPRQARLIINRACCPTASEPFRTLRAKSELGKRRRYQSVWASLICFLVYCLDNSIGVKEMGLHLGRTLEKGVLHVLDSIETGIMATEEAAVEDFCINMFKEVLPTASKNPLLWWMTVLARSAIDPASDFISQGRFLMNILPMDLDLTGRVEALQHYTKVFVLHFATKKWMWDLQGPADEVHDYLDSQNWSEDDLGQQPPNDEISRGCDSTVRTEMLASLSPIAMAYLSARKDVDTVGGEVHNFLSLGVS